MHETEKREGVASVFDEENLGGGLPYFGPVPVLECSCCSHAQNKMLAETKTAQSPLDRTALVLKGDDATVGRSSLHSVASGTNRNRLYLPRVRFAFNAMSSARQDPACPSRRPYALLYPSSAALAPLPIATRSTTQDPRGRWKLPLPTQGASQPCNKGARLCPAAAANLPKQTSQDDAARTLCWLRRIVRPFDTFAPQRVTFAASSVTGSGVYHHCCLCQFRIGITAHGRVEANPF